MPERALRAVFVRSILAHAASSASTSPRRRRCRGRGRLPGEGPYHRGRAREATVRAPGLRIRRRAVRGRATRARGRRHPRPAQDAAETVVPELEPLPVVLDPRAAADPGRRSVPRRAALDVADAFEEAWDEDVLAGSDVVARVTFATSGSRPLRSRPRRCSPSPAATARSRCGRRRRSRSPCGIRSANASPRGGPGPRGGAGRRWWVRRQAGSLPEYVAIAAAAAGWARRSRGCRRDPESMVSLTHGRAQVHEVELGATREGASSVSAWTSCPTWAPTRSPRTWRTRRGRCCRACTASRASRRGSRW